MKRLLLLLLLLLLVAAALVGCPTGPVSFCEAQLRAQCQFFFRCCEDVERLSGNGGLLNYATSEDECFDRTRAVCQARSAASEDSIGLGRLKFDGDQANVCLAAFNTMRDTCDRGAAAHVAACDDTTAGLVKDGGACALDEECGRGGLCAVNRDNPDVNKDTGALEGKCTAPAAKGDACGDTPCERGLVCNVDAGGNGTCVDPPASGDPCATGQCATGLFCDLADGKCKDLKDDGTACTNAFECKTDVCVNALCGDGTCNGKKAQ